METKKKKCTKCGLPLSVAAFFKRKASTDGLHNNCRSCVSLTVAARRLRNIKNGTLQSYKSPFPVSAARSYAAKYRVGNLSKKAIHRRIYRAVRSGAIQRGPCRVCGSLKVEAHHEDYSKPLDVIWLCRKHHKELHRKYFPSKIEGDGLMIDGEIAR